MKTNNKRKKVAVFTLQTVNYGNRLQNYATNYVLNKLGYQAVTISSFNDSFVKTKILIKRFIRKLLIHDYVNKFYDFNHKIKYTNYNIKNIKPHLNELYAIVAGSDQIWNTSFDSVSIDCFLPFDHPKKIAWAASFGTNEVICNEDIVRWLNKFEYISVREDAGASIIKRLISKEVPVLIDPTLLLSTQEWRNFSKKPKHVTEKYILTYFISPKCQEAIQQLNSLSQDCIVINLLDINDKTAKDVGPEEFVWLFDNAKIILTDSFHACVFSFIFNKPFIVYDRNWNEGNMNSRMETFLNKFHLERKYNKYNEYNDIWEHDYFEGKEVLNIEIEKTLAFLKDALQ